MLSGRRTALFLRENRRFPAGKHAQSRSQAAILGNQRMYPNDSGQRVHIMCIGGNGKWLALNRTGTRRISRKTAGAVAVPMAGCLRARKAVIAADLR